eukprot:CAMPEP_0168690776 /NCGR_PEP_ID=MMETSP0503-20121227/32335_1 /TAXON_ID=89963 /ORGANISM="Heterocapsa rotundata, Strain SCCAP K-0483" /LENGTH=59 /DNA_ID=CAMNT_0008736165 /DNA_START=9 /DNA_END=185 /DNA_ORIENTATION=+
MSGQPPGFWREGCLPCLLERRPTLVSAQSVKKEVLNAAPHLLAQMHEPPLTFGGDIRTS